ncbi:hypothetical protein HK097_007215 [Rhizophlyctis rosea]|uniref:Centrosomal protein CEP104 Zn finger domain-containing protein n=1 Tax=Rhizophlyctis rosea TaxID=64517 RepID=A0AAD5SJP5_9FUNG|nr:hypothetical protein HK097_007215 [Rhizophlyctis rosea]
MCLKPFLGDSREKMIVGVLGLWARLAAANETAKIAPNVYFHYYAEMVPALLLRAADPNPRVKQSATALVKSLATGHHQEPFNICPYVQKSTDKKIGGSGATHWRHAQARLELVQWMVANFGVGKRGAFGVTPALNFVSSHLQSPTKEVRESALPAFVEIVKRTGQEDDQVQRIMKGLNPHQLQALDRSLDGQGGKKPTIRMQSVKKGLPQKPGIPKPKPTKGGTGAVDAAEPVSKQPAKVGAKSDRTLPSHPLAEEVESLKRQLANGAGGSGDGQSRLPRPQARDKRSPSDFNENDWNIDGTCMFCNEKSEDFTEEGLDYHFWKECPFLMRCPACRSIIEIPEFTTHVKTDCPQKSLVRICPRCKMPLMDGDDWVAHEAANTCRPAARNSTQARCPLCEADIAGGEKVWKAHLVGIGPGSCQDNPRRAKGAGKGTDADRSGKASNGVGGKKLVNKGRGK